MVSTLYFSVNVFPLKARAEKQLQVHYLRSLAQCYIQRNVSNTCPSITNNNDLIPFRCGGTHVVHMLEHRFGLPTLNEAKPFTTNKEILEFNNGLLIQVTNSKPVGNAVHGETRYF